MKFSIKNSSSVVGRVLLNLVGIAMFFASVATSVTIGSMVYSYVKSESLTVLVTFVTYFASQAGRKFLIQSFTPQER
jgi:hypothetical protein